MFSELLATAADKRLDPMVTRTLPLEKVPTA